RPLCAQHFRCEFYALARCCLEEIKNFVAYKARVDISIARAVLEHLDVLGCVEHDCIGRPQIAVVSTPSNWASAFFTAIHVLNSSIRARYRSGAQPC
ncbi:hypothetical protein PENTCL1PPCAC_28596, partial [Pristionchus entomophagus]